MAQANWMQARQDQGVTEFIVQGVADWRECLSSPVKLSEGWARRCGGEEVPLMDYVRKEAEVNNHSFERSVVIAFSRLGYQLEELEVEIDSSKAKGWGRCVWYKEHPAYDQPIDDLFRDMGFEPRLYHAMWKTENAGDQHYCIYSVQMSLNGWLPHKTLIYRRVVFSPPGQKKSVAA